MLKIPPGQPGGIFARQIQMMFAVYEF
jgi:hypothetical protein